MNPTTLRLGKHPARHDPRTFKAARYLSTVAPAPASCDWTSSMGSLGMMLNDSLGDCTCAAAGHLVQAWTGKANPPPVVMPDAVILNAYEAQGYNPADPSTDRGACEIDVLNYWRQQGLGGSGHKIAAFASLNVKNQDEVKQAIYLFGGIYVGVALPLSAQNQSYWDLVTDSVQGAAGSWGGHAIPIVAYDETYLTCITWGQFKRMTWAFFFTYCDEAYALITPDWIERDGDSPSGLDLETLQADLLSIGTQVETPFPPPSAVDPSLAIFPTQPVFTPLTAAQCRAIGGPRQIWEFAQDWVCPWGTIPKGFRTDLGSTPPAIWPIISPSDPQALDAFCRHDRRYSVSGKGQMPDGSDMPRDHADVELHDGMIALGAPAWKADAVLAGVRIGGGSHWGTNATCRPPEGPSR